MMMGNQSPISRLVFVDDEFRYDETTDYEHLQGPVDSNIHLGHLQPAAASDSEDNFDRGVRWIVAPDQSESSNNPNSPPPSPSRKRAAPADDISNDISNDTSEHVSKRQKTTSSAWFGVGDPIYCNFGHIRFNGLYRVESIEEDEVVLRKTWPSEGAGGQKRVTVKSTEAKLEKKLWITAKDHTVTPPEY